ncbi:tryptophan-rich sensory protein [Candidatus Woesearchaeota archaeon]|nr:tryptophan-rich sensory protein [Candidatus Woesearchaeota archaeon]
MKVKLKTLSLSVIGCLLVGFLSSFFTTKSIPTWYAQLQKPIFNPPNWIFGPVWTVLYIMMGVSLYLVLSSKKHNKQGIRVFVIQLILNFFWSIIFFGLKLPILALIEILALWIFIFITILEFKKTSKLASNLLWPYLAWVSFATILNLSIVILN